MRKRRTREHVIADLSVNHVERKILLYGHTVENTRHDYGYDLLMTTYDINGESESGEIRLQLKATDALPILKGGGTVSWRIERSDLARWMNDHFPVILAVYDEQAQMAYWLYVQRYFQALPDFNLFAAGKTVTAYIPREHVLDAAAVRQFALFRDSVFQQMTGGIRHDA